jgi:hypothetical protein
LGEDMESRQAIAKQINELQMKLRQIDEENAIKHAKNFVGKYFTYFHDGNEHITKYFYVKRIDEIGNIRCAKIFVYGDDIHYEFKKDGICNDWELETEITKESFMNRLQDAITDLELLLTE